MIDVRNPTVVTSTSKHSTLASEIIRNVKVILGTLEGEVACDRSFGLDPNFIDQNMNLAKQLYTITAIEKIETYETRARVEKITFNSTELEGLLIPKVVIKIES